MARNSNSTNVFRVMNCFHLSQALDFTCLEAGTINLKLLNKGPNIISQSFK